MVRLTLAIDSLRAFREKADTNPADRLNAWKAEGTLQHQLGFLMGRRSLATGTTKAVAVGQAAEADYSKLTSDEQAKEVGICLEWIDAQENTTLDMLRADN